MILKRYTEFLNESNDIDFRVDMMKKLKKKLGAKNVNNEINYKNYSTGRIETNWNMFFSIYIRYSVEDYSFVNNDNFNYIWDNINSHNIPQNENGKKYIEYLINTYKPSYEKIEKLFENIASYDVTPLVKYLITMIKEEKIGELVHNVLPYGSRFNTNNAKKASLYYDLDFYRFEGEKDSTYYKGSRLVSNEFLLTFMSYDYIKDVAFKVMKKEGFKYNEKFFEKLVKHPNNGGINNNAESFKRKLVKLFEIQAFKKYIIDNPSIINLKVKDKIFYDYIPDDIKNHKNIVNFLTSKKGITKYKL